MNDHDSEVLRGLLEKAGYERAASEETADVIILNTCCVRERAENKVFGYLGKLKALKASKPGLVIGVGGCMAQRQGMAEAIRRQAPHVDVIFGTHNLHRVPELVRMARETRQAQLEVWSRPLEDIPEGLPVRREDGLKAHVTITYGCNNFCTYCIVPYVRGRERSRPPEVILEEIRGLAAEGYKEVMLLGQNVNSYGRDLNNGVDFADLLAMVDGIAGIERVRYTTSHPKDFSRRLINAVAACAKVCEHFHLPVQAGSDAVLARMHRRYTRDDYFRLVDQIRARVPGASITTDLIVGFPGETEDDFAATLDLVERVRFDSAYTFIYSPRAGTKAAGFPDQVEAEVKKNRLVRLVERQNRISQEVNQELLGQEVEVLVEGPSKTNPEVLSGRTRTNKIVIFSGQARPGELQRVRITEAGAWTLFGEPVARKVRGRVLARQAEQLQPGIWWRYSW
ncbi:MAG: tRNA (N6-isopentenyl adenosine(37)-C2)-methylthiotransferase MiaB [Clostridia bacterium]|nr:MAG: tRNA (N6-isopentenyl adenosine(37)-C2)-methylthiotransferase MiaB [Clostridia bacterium]